jgi:hypothetical protein
VIGLERGNRYVGIVGDMPFPRRKWEEKKKQTDTTQNFVRSVLKKILIPAYRFTSMVVCFQLPQTALDLGFPWFMRGESVWLSCPPLHPVPLGVGMTRSFGFKL